MTRLHPRAAEAFWLLLAAAILATLAIAIFREFESLEHVLAFGTARMPYSDALGPWFLGGLSLHFGLPPPTFLYRPTIGLFWGSLVAAAEQTAAIPVFFCAWLLAFLAVAMTAAGEARTRHALVIGFGACALAFKAMWGTLYIPSLGVDLAALAFTASGSVLLLWGRDPAARAPLLVGCLCLGIAAAIRGPLLVAGPLMIAVRLLLVERAGARTFAACVVLFLAPVIADLVLQRAFGVASNGLASLYCVYSDPGRSWNGACHTAYLAAAPGAVEVFTRVLALLFTDAGSEWFLAAVRHRMFTDLHALAAWPSLALVLAGGLATTATGGPPRTARVSRVVLVAASLWLASAIEWRYLAVAWVLLALCAAAALRSWRAFLLLAGYLASTLFLGAMGLAGHDRLHHTISFLLFLGAAFLAVDDPRAPAARAGRVEKVLPIFVAAAVAFLYLGFLLPSGWKDAYLARVNGRDDAALKVADDPRVDRSLYYLGDRRFAYVRRDALAVGAVREHRGLARPERDNASFEKPNAFLD